MEQESKSRRRKKFRVDPYACVGCEVRSAGSSVSGLGFGVAVGVGVKAHGGDLREG